MTRPDRIRSPRAAMRSRPLRLGAAGLMVLGIACGAVSAPASAVPVESPLRAQEPVQTDDSAANVEVVLAPAEPVLQQDAEEFEFRVLIRNSGKDPAAAGELRLELRPQPLSDPDELTDGFPDVGTPVATVEARETAPDSTQELSLRVPRSDLLLSSDAEGVYLMRAVLDSTSEDDAEAQPSPSALAPIIWGGAGDADPVPLSTIVPLTLPDEVRSMPTREQLGDAVPRLSALVDSAEALGSTLAVDPRIIAGIRAYGTAAPADAQDLLVRLSNTSAPMFLLQFADADPAAQAALGLDELLSPLNLDFVTKHGEFPDIVNPDEGDDAGNGNADETGTEPTDSAQTDAAQNDAEDGADGSDAGGGADAAQGDGTAADPEPTETPAAPEPTAESGVPPTLAELLAWSDDEPTAWPAAGATDLATLELLNRSGIGTVIVDSGNVTRTGGPRVQLRNGEKSIASGVVVDRELRIQAERALVGEHEVDRAAGLGSTAAELVLAAQNDSDGLVLALDRGATAMEDLPADAAPALLETIADLGWVDPVPIAEQKSGDASLSSGGTEEQRLELLRAALGREPDVQAMGPLLERPDELVGYQRTRLLQLFATRHAGSEGGFAAVAEHYAERDTELLQGVRVTRAESTHLVGTSTRVPVQVHNSLPFDALITGDVRPSSAALSVEERTIEPTIVPADGNQHILVPVLSRVSSGESGLVVTLRDATEGKEFDSSTIPISISSSVETIALTTLVGLTVALFGFGVWRSVKRRRSDASARRAPASPAGE